MTQSWHDLLFAHWPVDPSVLRAIVPTVLPLDLFDGRAWIGVVPFHMSNVAPRLLSGARMAFPELNVRTYVTMGDKPGVYFFSLDATSRLAVTTARLLFGLPYFSATMRADVQGQTIRYSSHRAGIPQAEFIADYEPTGAPTQAHPGSLEYFLTERYCLYTVRRGVVRRGDVLHPPWMLQPATARIEVNTMAAAAGMTLPSRTPHLLFARRQDVVVWLPRRT